MKFTKHVNEVLSKVGLSGNGNAEVEVGIEELMNVVFSLDSCVANCALSNLGVSEQRLNEEMHIALGDLTKTRAAWRLS